MSYRDHSQERSHTSAMLKMAWDEAREDRQFSEEELDELETLINEGYIQAELSRLGSAMRVQLEHAPDTFPNRSAQDLLRDIESYCRRFHEQRNRILLSGKQQDAA